MLQSRLAGRQCVGEDWVQAAAGAARSTARRRRLSGNDADDLRSELWLKLLRREGAALKQFAGRGSLRSYLASVADRCLLDQRVRELGKWRPSKAARALGATAVLMEQLTQRDGMSLEEAMNAIRSRPGMNEHDLRRAVSSLPGARGPRRMIPLEQVLSLPCAEASPELQLERTQANGRADLVRSALARGLNRLSTDDRNLLRRRFVDGASVADISRTDRTNQKQLYRRIGRLCQRLRMDLLAVGVTAADVRSVVGFATSPLDSILDDAGRRGSPTPSAT